MVHSVTPEHLSIGGGLDVMSAFRGHKPIPPRRMSALGYEPVNPGKTRRSRRKFRQRDTGRMIFMDEPHDGEMKPGMVRRLRDDLEQRGEL